MKTPQPAGKRFARAGAGMKKAPCRGQADKFYKKPIKKPRKDVARVQFRVKNRLAKGKPTRSYYPTRASHPRGDGGPPQRRTQKHDEKALRRIAREEVVKFLEGHVDRVESAVALLEELPDMLLRCEDGIKRLQDEVRGLREEELVVLEDDQEPWEVPMLPDHLRDTVFPQDLSDPVRPEAP